VAALLQSLSFSKHAAVYIVITLIPVTVEWCLFWSVCSLCASWACCILFHFDSLPCCIVFSSISGHTASSNYNVIKYIYCVKYMYLLFSERFKTVIHCCAVWNSYIKILFPPPPNLHTTNTVTFSISSSLCADYSSSPCHQDLLWCWCLCYWQHRLLCSGYGWWSCLQYSVLRNALVTAEDSTSFVTFHH
jgi:hypothetical protein